MLSHHVLSNVANYFLCGFVLIWIIVPQIKFRAWLVPTTAGYVGVTNFLSLAFLHGKQYKESSSRGRYLRHFHFDLNSSHYSNNYSSVLEAPGILHNNSINHVCLLFPGEWLTDLTYRMNNFFAFLRGRPFDFMHNGKVLNSIFSW